MKKSVLFAGAAALMMCFASCNGGKKAETTPVEEPAAEAAAPEYKLLDLPTVDLSTFPKDNDGWITLFDGKTLNGCYPYQRFRHG